MPLSKQISPIITIVSALLIVLIGYLFFSGHMLQFYASVVFGFYALTHSMWVSVVLLGIFQTLVLIPLRIIKLRRQDSIKEFEAQVKKLGESENQIKYLKSNAQTGNRAFLLYVVDFLIQLTTFLTIGRLFLKDFYAYKLDPKLIYDFIPYPKYPIQSTFFKIPYPRAAETINLGVGILLVVWALIVLVQFFVFYLKRNAAQKKIVLPNTVNRLTIFITTSTILFFIASYFVVTRFPTGIEMAVFSGDISKPNKTFNTITAVVTFLTMLWFNLNRIDRKSRAAERAGLSQTVIQTTEQKLFNQALRDSLLVGLGAYFITNHIPSAFELSVFTLEIISMTSPFTLDKLITKSVNLSPAVK